MATSLLALWWRERGVGRCICAEDFRPFRRAWCQSEVNGEQVFALVAVEPVVGGVVPTHSGQPFDLLGTLAERAGVGVKPGVPLGAHVVRHVNAPAGGKPTLPRLTHGGEQSCTGLPAMGIALSYESLRRFRGVKARGRPRSAVERGTVRDIAEEWRLGVIAKGGFAAPHERPT